MTVEKTRNWDTGALVKPDDSIVSCYVVLGNAEVGYCSCIVYWLECCIHSVQAITQ
jgi:hypothetical protein